MKNLFLVDGATGTGKADLIHHVADFNIDAVYVKKITTRPQRSYEINNAAWTLDLTFVSEEEFNRQNPYYSYAYGGFKYGFCRSDLDKALGQSANVFVIARNANIIKRVQEDYNFINVVPIFVYSDPEKAEKRLREDGLEEKWIEFRRERHDISFQDYLRNPCMYREILINNASKDEYHRLIDCLLEQYRSEPDVNEKRIFILMSFNPSNPVLEDYYKAMKRAAACYDSTFECTSLHEIAGSFKISKTATEYIKNSRLVIVDLNENKPNVYYELGYAHGISKKFIITAHIDTPRHFYPAEYKILYYENASDLERKLHRELAGVLGNTTSNSQ